MNSTFYLNFFFILSRSISGVERPDSNFPFRQRLHSACEEEKKMRTKSIKPQEHAVSHGRCETSSALISASRFRLTSSCLR